MKTLPEGIGSLISGFMVVGLCILPSCMKPSHDRDQPAPEEDPALNDPDPTPDPAPDTTSDPTPNPPRFGLTVEPTVESIQKDLLDVYCVPCHSGAMPPKKLNLSDITKFLPPNNPHTNPNGYHGTLVAPGRPDDSMLVLVMRSRRPADQMPPPDSPFPLVTDDQLRVVETWISSMEDPDGGSTDEPGDDGGGDDEPGAGDGASDEPGTDDGNGDEPGDGE